MLDSIGDTATSRVLVVDDDEGVLRVLRRSLQFICEFSSASSTREALEVLNEQGPFAVVLTDYSMPGDNGAELILRAREQHPDTVYVILSGNQDERASDAIADVQPFRVLAKPCEMALIRDTVAEAMDHFSKRVSRNPVGS